MSLVAKAYGSMDPEAIKYAKECVHKALQPNCPTITYKKFRRNHRHYLSLVMSGQPVNIKESKHWGREAQTFFPPAALYPLKFAYVLMYKMADGSTLLQALDYLEALQHAKPAEG